MNLPPSKAKKRGKGFSKYLKLMKAIAHHGLMGFQGRTQHSVTKMLKQLFLYTSMHDA